MCDHLFILEKRDCFHPEGLNNLSYDKFYCQKCRKTEWQQGDGGAFTHHYAMNWITKYPGRNKEDLIKMGIL